MTETAARVGESVGEPSLNTLLMTPPKTEALTDMLPKGIESSHSSPAAQAVFEKLLQAIVSGNHPAHTRLPSERDLATDLSASRPTIREAIRRLVEWGLVIAQRGSGIVVQPMRDWSLDVLPAFLAYGATSHQANGGTDFGQTLADILTVRKLLLCSLSQVVATRLGASDIETAQNCVEAAWAARGTADFARLDFEIFRTLAEAANCLPALWLLNGLGSVYSDIAARLSQSLGPPSDYLESYRRIFRALARGNGKACARLLGEFYDRQDSHLLKTINIATPDEKLPHER